MNPLLELSVGMDLSSGVGGRRKVVCVHMRPSVSVHFVARARPEDLRLPLLGESYRL